MEARAPGGMYQTGQSCARLSRDRSLLSTPRLAHRLPIHMRLGVSIPSWLLSSASSRTQANCPPFAPARGQEMAANGWNGAGRAAPGAKTEWPRRVGSGRFRGKRRLLHITDDL